MMRTALLSVLLLAAPQAAFAQVTDDATVNAIAETLPESLGGLQGEWADISDIDPGAVQMRYVSKEGMGPSIGITLHRTGPFDWTVQLDGMRKIFAGPFFQIVNEGTFTVPGKTGTQSFFGEYSTQMGLRQIWKLKQGDVEMSVLVIIFRKEDRIPMLDAVSKDLFGGVSFVKGPPALTPAN